MTLCVDDIPPGYYCNNSLENTIDKCHDNCETCDYGGNDENNNCTSCQKTGKIFLDLGNCVENCTNGNFMDNSINKCKCATNITCQSCSKESKKNNLCDTCNIEKGYYPKEDDNNNFGQFINCYNEDSIYGVCSFYYYLNNSKYYCTKDKNCPKEFNLLIIAKEKCIEDCKKDSNYIYEYGGICYDYQKNNNSQELDSEDNCPPNSPYLVSETNKCVNECDASDLINQLCKSNNPNNNIKQDDFNKIREAIISKSIESLLV